MNSSILSSESDHAIVDDVLPDPLFEKLRRHAMALEYADVENPADGVMYPGISPAVPLWATAWVKSAAAKSMGIPVPNLQVELTFFRLTTKYTPPAPHGAHNDAVHSSFAAFYYIGDAPPDLEAGTALVSHRNVGMPWGAEDEHQLEVWKRDTNNYDAWKIDQLIPWKPNRLAVVRADRMHRGEPPGGWGETAQDGRLVLITFFS